MRIAREIRRGALPRPNTVPCVDCGHVWAAGNSRHEYDHYLGYAAEHHEAVEVVCKVCHRRRTDERVVHLAFIRGWLACLAYRWINRDEETTYDLTDAF